ncbi:MAG TPA: DUF2231 domain-containing protein [Gemmatimonadales bacterium]|jgi:uncharacterized membrane protein
MPNIGEYHPQIVHFAIVLLAVGVLFRWISLTGRAAFTGPAAAVLLLAGTLAAVLAVRSGTDAHGPVERVPGARQAVVDHEEWGERTRNIFLIVAALEIAALVATRRSPRFTEGFTIASAVVGLAGGAAIYETGEHGGDLVYSYAGGVGIRSGDSTDVQRLLVAGLYHAAQQARARHDSAGAAELFGELARRFPDDTAVRLLAIESLIRDRRDAKGALVALAKVTVPADNQRLRLRAGSLKADAFEVAGQRDSVRATLEQLARDFPDNTRIRDRLARM